MEDPDVRTPNPVRISRAQEAGRLEGRIMSDAYERLIPIVRCVCGEPNPCAAGTPADARHGGPVERKGAAA